MPRKIPRLVWAVLPLAYLLYFYGLGAVGLLGKDEPRYASVAREMARSGDWVTPRLWGQPWFEKPALSYWMIGAGFRLGLGPDLAPRLPVALLAVAFLGFYWWILGREFGCRAAWMATLILGTTGMWIGYSQVGVTDLPLTATFSAAMLLCLPWVARRDGRFLPAAGALLGLAALAKGLVPLALAAPLIWWMKDWWMKSPPARKQSGTNVPLLRMIAAFSVVALPWYLLCYWRNGRAFFDDFILKQHFARITSSSLMHVQPWWFYWRWLPGELLPWTPLLLLLARPAAYRDPRRRFLLALVLFGMLVFSIPVNKLPGYVLPLMPAIAALMGVALDEAAGERLLLACCGMVLMVFPLAAAVLPEALNRGLTRVALPAFQPAWLLAAAPALLAWWLEGRGRRLAAVFTVAAGVSAGVFYLKWAVAPELNRAVSARDLWAQIAGRAGEVCVDNVDQSWRYGLNYYSVTPLPECSEQPRPWRVRQTPGNPPHIDPSPAAL
jgi:4-amino-4-deoxy-L-arabinose transferase-like glycosyltransferase